MNIRQLKNIMKEINEPNEFELFAHDLLHPYYWIYKIENVRVKTLFSKLESLRKRRTKEKKKTVADFKTRTERNKKDARLYCRRAFSS